MGQGILVLYHNQVGKRIKQCSTYNLLFTEAGYYGWSKLRIIRLSLLISNCVGYWIVTHQYLVEIHWYYLVSSMDIILDTIMFRIIMYVHTKITGL